MTRLAVFALLLIAGIQNASAQQLVEQRPPGVDEASDIRVQQVQQQVEPAFLIEPLVHAIEARPGQLLTFNFDIKSKRESTRLEIRPIAMSQRENGVIMPDEQSPDPGVLRLLTASSVTLRQGESHRITCQVRVPAERTPFISFGALVKELPPEPGTPSADAEPRVGINFVTQYLLRADISVLGVRGDAVSKLKIDSSELVPSAGYAMARLKIVNETNTSMEFGVRCQLTSLSTGRATRPFELCMPVRMQLPEPDRYRGRILQQATLLMQDILPQAVFPGEYELRCELTDQGRVLKAETFPVTISDGDFPAQDARIVRVAEDIEISPPTVELSLQKGGRRFHSFVVANNSQQTVTAGLNLRSLQGELADALTIRPESFILKPGRTQKVLVLLGRNRDFTEHAYAAVEVKVQPEEGTVLGTQEVPIALLTGEGSDPILEPGELAWEASPTRYGFTLPLKNAGTRHVELNARLTLYDTFNRGIAVDSGFGRWLLPGESTALSFPFRQIPPAGRYTVLLQLQQAPGLPNMELRQQIEIEDILQQRVSSDEAATATQ